MGNKKESKAQRNVSDHMGFRFEVEIQIEVDIDIRANCITERADEFFDMAIQGKKDATA